MGRQVCEGATPVSLALELDIVPLGHRYSVTYTNVTQGIDGLGGLVVRHLPQQQTWV